jgi:dihydrofolate reductase
MRKLFISVVVSLDGYVTAPGGEFVAPEWSGDLDRWTGDLRSRADTLVMGRHTWDMMTGYWPAAETAPDMPEPQREVARFMNRSRKIVFSRTLENADAWENSGLAGGDVASVMGAEKRKEGKDIAILGSPLLAQTAIRADVIDEYWLLTLPRLFGGGTRLFDGHALRADLKLLELRQMDTGAVFTRYERLSSVA